MCDSSHAGPCRYLTTQMFRRLHLPSGGNLTVSDQRFAGVYHYATTSVPLTRLPGVYLLGNFYVGSSSDIGLHLTSFQQQLNQGNGEAFTAFTRFLERHDGFLPRLSILSLNELDVDYCATNLSSLRYPLTNASTHGAERPVCVVQVEPMRQERLQSILGEVNRRQDFSVHSK